MLTYYSKFLPNLSTLLHPLYELLRKDVKWKWGDAQNQSFNASKDLLMSEKCVTFFDSTLDLTLLRCIKDWEQKLNAENA